VIPISTRTCKIIDMISIICIININSIINISDIIIISVLMLSFAPLVQNNMHHLEALGPPTATSQRRRSGLTRGSYQIQWCSTSWLQSISRQTLLQLPSLGHGHD
jgi:hypothetical protein